MSQNLEVKLARNTELAFTEAYLTDLKPDSFTIMALYKFTYLLIALNFCVLPGDCKAASHGSFSCSFPAGDFDLRVFLS